MQKLEVQRRKCLLLWLLWLLLLLIPYAATSQPELVINADSGEVLHQQDPLRSWYPASLTKMMTLYMTFMALEQKALSLNEKLPISAHAAAQPSTRLGITKGDTIAVRKAITAVATISANDAAVVLAERLAESEEMFAQKMTAQARKMGMINSIFHNASGLTDEQQKTTARDMALLGRQLFHDFPDHFPYFSNRIVSYKGRQHNATNGLIGAYAGADGIKAGFTCHSGYNMVASAERDGVRLIAVVLGSKSSANRNQRIKKLLDKGFEKTSQEASNTPFELLRIMPADDRPPPIRLSKSECAASATLTRTPLPGWGILLGVFQNRKLASSAVWKARSKLSGIIGASRAAILQRKFNKRTSWKALLVGLNRKSAGKACKRLWSLNLACVAQSPQSMNRKGFTIR